MNNAVIKTEDYREVNHYLIKRILSKKYNNPKSTYTERILKLEHKRIEIRTGNPEQGAEQNKIYFVNKHGKDISLNKMKPKEKQIELILKIASEIKGWASTNDIDSPSNWNLITEFCESLEIPAKQELKLNEAFDQIMLIIKQQNK